MNSPIVGSRVKPFTPDVDSFIENRCFKQSLLSMDKLSTLYNVNDQLCCLQ